MTKYILLIRNIYTKDEAYGPYDSRDNLRLQLLQLYGNDWTNSNFEIIELKTPSDLQILNLKSTRKVNLPDCYINWAVP